MYWFIQQLCFTVGGNTDEVHAQSQLLGLLVVLRSIRQVSGTEINRMKCLNTVQEVDANWCQEEERTAHWRRGEWSNWTNTEEDSECHLPSQSKELGHQNWGRRGWCSWSLRQLPENCLPCMKQKWMTTRWYAETKQKSKEGEQLSERVARQGVTMVTGQGWCPLLGGPLAQCHRPPLEPELLALSPGLTLYSLSDGELRRFLDLPVLRRLIFKVPVIIMVPPPWGIDSMMNWINIGKGLRVVPVTW